MFIFTYRTCVWTWIDARGQRRVDVPVSLSRCRCAYVCLKKKNKFWNGALKKENRVSILEFLLEEQKRRRRSKSSTDLARLFLEAAKGRSGQTKEFRWRDHC